MFSWQGELPLEAPHGLCLAGEQRGQSFLRGFVCYGVPIGEDQYVSARLRDRAQQIVDDGMKVVEVLGGHKQALWSCLRLSVVQRFDYWLQLFWPSDIQPVAPWLDQQLWLILEHADGFGIPRASEGKGWDIAMVVPG